MADILPKEERERIKKIAKQWYKDGVESIIDPETGKEYWVNCIRDMVHEVRK